MEQQRYDYRVKKKMFKLVNPFYPGENEYYYPIVV